MIVGCAYASALETASAACLSALTRSMVSPLLLVRPGWC
jgi:hypothetical protein